MVETPFYDLERTRYEERVTRGVAEVNARFAAKPAAKKVAAPRKRAAKKAPARSG